MRRDENVICPEEKLRRDDNVICPEEKLRRDDNVICPEEKLRRDDNVICPEEKLRRDDNVICPEEKLRRDDNVICPEEKLRRDDNVICPEEKLRRDENVMVVSLAQGCYFFPSDFIPHLMGLCFHGSTAPSFIICSPWAGMLTLLHLERGAVFVGRRLYCLTHQLLLCPAGHLRRA